MDIRYITVLDDGYVFYEYNRHFFCYWKPDKRIRVISLPDWTWNVRFAIKKQNRIFLPYGRGLSFWEISLLDESITGRYDYFDEHNSTIAGFSYHLLYDDIIWCFPDDFCDSVYYFNTCDKTFAEFKEWNKFVEQNNLKSFKAINGTVKNSDCFMPLYGTNKLIHFNGNNKDFILKSLSEGSARVSSGCFDGKYLWLLTEFGEELFLCDTDCNVLDRTALGINEEGFFGKIFDCDDTLVILPRHGDAILFFNKSTKSINRLNINVDREIIVDRRNWSKIISCAKIGNKIMFPGNSLEILFSTDSKGGNFQRINSLFDSGVDLYINHYRHKKIVTESENATLQAFLQMIDE